MNKTVQECIDAYVKMSKEIFDVDWVLLGKVPYGDNKCRFDYNILEKSVQKLIEERLGDKNHTMSAKPKGPNGPTQCRTFDVARLMENVTAGPIIFRSYSSEEESKSKCPIWQAARATTAAPTFFKPMCITDPPPSIAYIDGGVGHNNPAEIALVEARTIWGADKTFCLISIGTGQQSPASAFEESSLETNIKVQNSLFNSVRIFSSTMPRKLIPCLENAENIPSGVLAILRMANVLQRVATTTEAVHDRLQRGAREYKFLYFRFNVERDVGDIGLEDWKSQSSLTSNTIAYMKLYEMKSRRIECAKHLVILQLVVCPYDYLRSY